MTTTEELMEYSDNTEMDPSILLIGKQLSSCLIHEGVERFLIDAGPFLNGKAVNIDKDTLRRIFIALPKPSNNFSYNVPVYSNLDDYQLDADDQFLIPTPQELFKLALTHLSEAESDLLAHKPNWHFEAARDFININFEKDYEFIDSAMVLVPFVLENPQNLVYEDAWWFANTLYDTTVMVEGEEQAIKTLYALIQLNESPSIQSFAYQKLVVINVFDGNIEKAQEYFDKAVQCDSSHPWIPETRERLNAELHKIKPKGVLKITVFIVLIIFVIYQLNSG